MNKKYILIFTIIIVFIIIWIWYAGKIKSPISPLLSPIAQVNYTCEYNKTINAIFYKGESKTVQPGQQPIPTGSVKLILSDGRKLDLPQTISADGGRYANSDESFIFWSKGDTAFINEGSATTFTNCISDTSNTASSSQTSTGVSKI